MFPYWGLCFYFIVMVFAELFLADTKYEKDSSKKIIIYYLFTLSYFVLVIFGGIRSIETGMDDGMYRGSFIEISSKSITFSIETIIGQYKYEPITSIIMVLVSRITKNADLFIFIYLMISVSINSHIYRKYTPLVLVSLAIYSSHLYLNKDLNQIRFGLSSALFVLALCFYSDAKYLKVALCMVLACLSHQTALAGIVIFIINPFLKGKYLPLLIVVLSIPLGLVGGKVLFSAFFGYLPSVVTGYQGSEFDTDMPVISIANFKNIIFIALFCYYLNVTKVKGNSTNSLVGVLILSYAVGASVRIVFHDFSIIGGRVGNLFLHVEPLLMSYLAFKLIRYRFFVFLFLITILVYYYYYNTYINPQSLLGYGVSDTFNAW